MAYTIASLDKHLTDGNYDWAVWGAVGIVLEKLYPKLSKDFRTDEEWRPIGMIRQAIRGARDKALITARDETEAIWLLGSYDALNQENKMPSRSEARKAIAIAQRFSQIP